MGSGKRNYSAMRKNYNRSKWKDVTRKEEKIEIICFILEVLDPDRHNKKFGYRGKWMAIL